MSLIKKTLVSLCLSVFLATAFLWLLSPSSACAFQQKITEFRAVKDVEIVVQYNKGIYWQMSVSNVDRPEPISILWDKSFYKSSSGRKSRLIRQKNQKIHPRDRQRSSTVVSGKKVVEVFTCEDLLPYATTGAPQPSDPSSAGSLSIALTINGKESRWIGTVMFIE